MTFETEEEFNEKFFDVRTNKPKYNHVMACFAANAEFVNGNEKKQIIDLLKMEGKTEAIINIMSRLHYASPGDSIKVPRQMAEDLLEMSEEEVLEKPYKYLLEMFYYCEKENVPNSPHWSVVSLMGRNGKIYSQQEIDERRAKKIELDNENQPLAQ